MNLALAFLIAAFPARATPVVGSWKPLFKGVDYSVSTNIPTGGNFPNRQVVHAFRVDLTDPDVRLLTTPRISNYVAGVSETGGLTVSDFLRTHHLQAAINANFFYPQSYYLPAGTPMDVYGLAISEGVVVSPEDGPDNASAILVDANNQATVIPTNWPPASVNGIYTAVSGDYPLVIAGRNVVNPGAREVNPRTVFGLSQDRHFLYLVGIDGRQPDYSDGANDYESAAWLLLLGAFDGINVDGGGSTTLVIEDSTGAPVRLNQSSAVADSGKERTVGSHLGVYAKPLLGFIKDVVAVADDTRVRITWTTFEPATSEVEYGFTTDFGNRTDVQPAPVTSHLVQLSGLSPGTGYYFRVISATAAQQYVSANYFFLTTNYVTTNRVFDLNNSWKYTITNLNGLSWSGTNYADSDWNGPGEGLLWVDVRATPNPDVQPKSTQMPTDPNNNGYPYVTYYFRTRFVLTNIVQGGSLEFSGYIDDGAVFYLNGAEIYRLRMPANSDASTLATNSPCGGDATCLDSFTMPMDSLPNLALGENVLAVEVHNYNRQSPDITFGLSLNRIEPIVRTVATNYVTTNRVFDIRNSWKYTTTNLNGVSWSGTNYADSDWNGPGASLLWVDVRATPNPDVQPKSTQMPTDPNNSGYPYVTYYFRTRFVLTNIVQGGSLGFSGYIDDGAVFYLNGAEIYRLRMPANSDASTFATNFPCGGDATCLDSFTIPMDSLPNLALGENVLAVEVHNYNRQSPDVTFGLSLDRIEPIVRTARIDVRYSTNAITLSWDVSGFVLQSADSPDGVWTNVGGSPGSPFTVEPLESRRYYRLGK